MRLPRVFRDLPLFWKLLLPFLTLLVIVGASGAFIIVRDLSSRAQTTLNQELLQASLRARALLNNQELSLLESANLAANLEGIAEAVAEGDRATVSRLFKSALAVKTDLNLLVATDHRGIGLIELFRRSTDGSIEQRQGTDWSTEGFVQQTLDDPLGRKSAGFLSPGARRLLAVVSPICPGDEPCEQVGAVIAGFTAGQLAVEAAGAGAGQPAAGVTLYDGDGHLLAHRGLSPGAERAPPETGAFVRRNERVDSTEIATLYAPLEVQGERQGTVGVTIPTEPIFASVRGTGLLLAGGLIAILLGIVAIGALLSRLILAQVRPLVKTNRELGKGDLSVRAPVLGDDELGELAQGVNQMAEQLQASRETLELRVAQRTEEVERLLQERTQFFASISHELRTPLAVILSEAKMMGDPAYRRRGAGGPEAIRKIEGAGDQLLGLIEDILQFARAETGRIEIDVEDVALPKFVEELTSTISGLAASGDLDLKVNIPPRLPTVRADPRRLREVLLNLVDNAVKYTPGGGRIELSAAHRDGNVEVSVSDTGIGIPEDARKRIFEPFYRVPGTETQRGEPASGLGLALTRRLVEAQGGTMAFESTPGKGSTFTFSLPKTDKGRSRKRAARRRATQVERK